MNPMERLQIIIRDNTGSTYDSDQFRMGSDRAYPLGIRTRAESLKYMEELGTQYSRWINALATQEEDCTAEEKDTNVLHGSDMDGPPLSDDMEDECELEDIDKVCHLPGVCLSPHISCIDSIKDSALYNDLPVDSSGEFISDTPSISSDLHSDCQVDSGGVIVKSDTPSISSELYSDLPVDSGGEFISNTPSISAELYSDLPVDSGGEFLSDTPSISSELYSDLPINSSGEFISNTPSVSHELYSDLPVNSCGEFISDAPSISTPLAWSSSREFDFCHMADP